MKDREMSQLAGDPARVRATAAGIARAFWEGLNDWQRTFLTEMQAFEGMEPLSVRQREALYFLREQISRTAMQSGFRAARLVAELWWMRFDLRACPVEFHEISWPWAEPIHQEKSAAHSCRYGQGFRRSGRPAPRPPEVALA